MRGSEALAARQASLAVREPETAALSRYLRRRRPLVASALVRSEVLRALLPAGERAVERGREVLRTLDLVRVNDQVLNAAGVLAPASLRSLDAIHLATARLLADELGAVVTYDEKMTAAARELGLRVACPL